jgi:hypothetical protein
MTQTQLVNEICSKFFATQISCGDSCVCEKLKGNLEAELPGIVSEMEEVLLNRGIVDYHSMLAACYTATLIVARMKEKQAESTPTTLLAPPVVYYDGTKEKNRFAYSSEHEVWTGKFEPSSTMPEGD